MLLLLKCSQNSTNLLPLPCPRQLQSHLDNLPLITPLRHSTAESPHLKKDRPKSDCLTVRWADSPGGATEPAEVQALGGARLGGVRKRVRAKGQERPKSDIGKFIYLT